MNKKSIRKQALLDAAQIVCVLCRIRPDTTGFDGCGFWVHTGLKGKFQWQEYCIASNIYRLMAHEKMIAWRSENPQEGQTPQVRKLLH